MNENFESYSTTKYVVRAKIAVDGVVEKSDVVGAIFGQTEGLLGEELDIRELQKTGRIGRIQVSIDSKGGKSTGIITIPSSLDKIETAILTAALETVDRVGPCLARVSMAKIEDVRDEKRKSIINRATHILRAWEDDVIPESQRISEEVIKAARIGVIIKYGKDQLPAGPEINESETIIVVEGRADVLNLLKHGFRNVIAVEGTSIPETIVNISRKKTAIAFVDGDRGGELVLKELLQLTEIDYVARAPPNREVEELSRKEIIKELRNKIPIEQYLEGYEKPRMEVKSVKRPTKVAPKKKKKSAQVPEPLIDSAENISETSEAVLFNEELNSIDSMPVSELTNKLQSIDGVHAIVFDGVITQRLSDIASEKNVKYLIGARLGKITKKPLDIELLTFQDILT
ncbi:MAG: DNA primase [Candidatus Lokiarchaeota archaeon]|nr:DNA primase [Candidatus Lokiarchaeota archaeon]